MKVHFKSLESKIALQVIILEELFLLSLTTINKITKLCFLGRYIKPVALCMSVDLSFLLFSFRSMNVYELNNACKK